MPNISIISASVRTGRNSHRLALYFKTYLEENKLATADIVDLKAYNFPIFEERLKFIKKPSAQMLEYAERIKHADGIIIVTPEYNGGYPPSLKNAIDFLYTEWRRKPIAIATASDGVFGGTQVITSLQFSLWKIHAWTVPQMFPAPKVNEAFDETGIPKDKEATDKRADVFIKELLWCITAKQLKDNQTM